MSIKCYTLSVIIIEAHSVYCGLIVCTEYSRHRCGVKPGEVEGVCVRACVGLSWSLGQSPTHWTQKKRCGLTQQSKQSDSHCKETHCPVQQGIKTQFDMHKT